MSKIPIEASEPRPPVPQWPVLATDRVDLSHLPATGAALFGRDEELSLLDEVWVSHGQVDDGVAMRVLAFKAQGGVGKSALINRWLAEMKRDHFRGATRVFGWSFYSQGVREQGAASANTFLAAALRFFGDEAMAGSLASAWDKGARLAHLVGAERALLVLDGMEPLQSAHWVDRGKLRDPGLESLLRGLAAQSAGFCVITTREPLAALGKKAGIVERDLEQITPQSGRALLRASHIVGTDAELERLAERFGPHALAISLLAVYLHEQPGHGIGPAKQIEELPGKEPVDRVLAGFEKMLANSAELEALRLLGFFDRPADEGCLRALRVQPAIPSLTDLVAGMSEADWPRVLARLDKLHLVHARQSDSGRRLVDAHPLIREYFAKQLREQNPDAWRAAHRRLYEHLCSTTQEGDRPTLEDLQPLYQAVAHGCHGHIFDEAWQLFTERIQRGSVYYGTRMLGAYGTSLGAMACFFRTPFSVAIAEVRQSLKGMVFQQCGICFRSLGRLTEAADSIRESLQIAESLGEALEATVRARNLGQTLLYLGDLRGADRFSEHSVELAAMPSVTDNEQIHVFARRADFLWAAGRNAEARRSFERAEEILRAANPRSRFLRGYPGYLFCQFLIDQKEFEEVEMRLTEPLPEDKTPSELNRALVRGLEQSLRIQLLIRKPNELALLRSGLPSANASVDLLRAAAEDIQLIRAVLTRAWLRFLTGTPTGSESAQADLDEAWEIAERGPMPLFMADIHLSRARLFGTRNTERGWRNEEAKYPWESPEKDLAEARRLIAKHGYGRRKGELEDAEQALGVRG